jgi:hypothetical protein
LHKSRRAKCFAALTQVNNLPSRQTILPRHGTFRVKEHAMMDVVLLALVFGLFAVSVGYTIACDRL